MENSTIGIIAFAGMLFGAGAVVGFVIGFVVSGMRRMR